MGRAFGLALLACAVSACERVPGYAQGSAKAPTTLYACITPTKVATVVLQASRPEPPACVRAAFYHGSGSSPGLEMSSGWSMSWGPAASKPESCAPPERPADILEMIAFQGSSGDGFSPVQAVRGTVSFSSDVPKTRRPEWIELDLVVESADPRAESVPVRGRIDLTSCPTS